jgi:cytochrome c peroxidase
MLRVGFLGAAVWLSGCEQDSNITRLPALTLVRASATPVAARTDAELSPGLLRRFAPLPKPPVDLDSERVRLGRVLYYEPLLSRNSKISCNSCHPLAQYGATITRFSVGVDGKPGRRNAQTVYNTAGHFNLFWDGRAANLTEQALGPLLSPTEMGMDPAVGERVLRAIPGYRDLFARAFPGDPEPIRMINVAAAIAEFERGLSTPARWDRYLEGDIHALSAEEKEGAKLFANLGCMVCHTGAYVGGATFEKLGIFQAWPNQSDRGRGEVTRNPADDMVFKVPSLRNVARTAPYFHDGSAASLDVAVRMMGRYQLGVDLTDPEAKSIVTWLGSLTGELPLRYIAPPELPAAERP